MSVEYFCKFFPVTRYLFLFALSAPWSLHRAKGMHTVAESVESCLKNLHYIICRVQQHVSALAAPLKRFWAAP
jgi:hypothetical protein